MFSVAPSNNNNIHASLLNCQSSSHPEENPCDIEPSLQTETTRRGDINLTLCDASLNEPSNVSSSSEIVVEFNEKQKYDMYQSKHSIQNDAILSQVNFESHNVTSAMTNTVVPNQTNQHEYAKDEIILNEKALHEKTDCMPNVCKDVKTDVTYSAVSTTNSMTGTPYSPY